MDPALTFSGSKSNEATYSGAKRRKVKMVAFIDNLEEMKEMVETFMKKDANGKRESVIGIEVEYAHSLGKVIPPSGQKTRISHLILSNGNIAYVVFLGIAARFPETLLRFLVHTEFTFVSMGMQQHIDNLSKRYEADCHNAIDLGELASNLKGNPRLRSCGIDLLAEGIGMHETPRPSKIVLKKGFDSLYRILEEDKLLKSVANTCAFQEIGKKLLFG